MLMDKPLETNHLFNQWPWSLFRCQTWPPRFGSPRSPLKNTENAPRGPIFLAACSPQGRPLRANIFKTCFRNVVEGFAIDLTCEDFVYNDTRRLLDNIVCDLRTHRPSPIAVAWKNIALRHGLHCETLLLTVANNVALLENPRTRAGAEAAPEVFFFFWMCTWRVPKWQRGGR